MPVIEPAIRPPAEAFSFLLQVTTGCYSNSCTFCGAYKGKPFSIKSTEEIDSDIKKGAFNNPETRKVFLMDGNALVLSNNKILPILKKINTAFPGLTRISSYANGENITKRSRDELDELYNNKLKLIYIGLESGSQQILNICKKKSTAEEMITAVQKARESKIKSSVIVLLGLGGKKYSRIHVQETIAALNRMQPRYLSFLSLMLVPGTELHKDSIKGDFQELSSTELLQETHDIITGLKLKQTIFRTNHASNYLPLEGRFPQDKERMINMLGEALNGNITLKPEFFRGL